MLSKIRSFEDKVPDINDSVYIDPTAVIIGDVIIGKDSSVWPTVVIRGDVNYIRIGERTSIQDGSILHVTHSGPFSLTGASLHIGNNVTIGHKVILHGCTIGDSCLIGMGSTILDGAIIESHVLIGAGSLIPPGKIINSGYLWLGQPIQKIRPLTEEEIFFLQYSADHYVKLKNRYLKV
ncbi:MAG: Protein YrdA [Legionellaceae bacterium]